MKSLVTILNEGLNDAADSLKIQEKIQNGEDVTLYELLQGHVMKYSYDRTFGFSHYQNVMDFCKAANKVSKADVLLNDSGKKPSEAGQIWKALAKVADTIIVDMKLEPTARLDKINADLEAACKKLGLSFDRNDGFITYITSDVTRYVHSSSVGHGRHGFEFKKSGEGLHWRFAGSSFRGMMSIDDMNFLTLIMDN